MVTINEYYADAVAIVRGYFPSAFRVVGIRRGEAVKNIKDHIV